MTQIHMISLPFTGESCAGRIDSEIPAFEFAVVATWIERIHMHTLVLCNSKTSYIYESATLLQPAKDEVNDTDIHFLLGKSFVLSVT